jgi:hypothetical protein
VELNTYALAVVAALTVASCLGLGMGLALISLRRSREHAGHAIGGRLLAPPGSDGLWGEHDAWAGSSRADEPAVEAHRRRRPLTADQKATRAAWARWRAAKTQAHANGD